MAYCQDLGASLFVKFTALSARASISQHYWGDIKEDSASGGRKSTSEVQGRSPGRRSGGRSPQELKLFYVKLHITFAFCIKIQLTNNRLLLGLLDKINLAAKYPFKTYIKHIFFFTFNQLWTRVDIPNNIISKILGRYLLPWTSPLHKYLGDMPPPLSHRDRRPWLSV